MRAQPALCLLSILAGSLTAQRPDSNRAPDRPRSAPQPTRPVSAADLAAVPAWLPVPIPSALYQKWRKYGEWDYKQRAFKYRDATRFNFAATGRAAGLDSESILALAQASRPTPNDVNALDDPKLQATFTRDGELLDRLRKMAEEDRHVIRIAPDFTWLDSISKWPRAAIGFSEARWNEYRGLFTNLTLREGIVRTEDFPGAIFFVARVRGLCVGGSSAGYVYSNTPLTPTADLPRDALDSEARQNPNRHYAYVFKPLRANWYAFYELDW